MAQYPIPQFIEEEGKIIFFLTFKQFFLLVGGGFACLLLYFTKVPFYVFLFGSIIIMTSVCMVAFLKINNQSVITVFLHFIGYSIGPKNYVWDKKESLYPVRIKNTYDMSKRPDNAVENIPTSKLKEAQKIVELKKK